MSPGSEGGTRRPDTLSSVARGPRQSAWGPCVLPVLIVVNLAFKLACVLAWPRSHWASVGLFVAPDLVLLFGLLHPRSQLLCRTITRFEPSTPGAKEVWLTIDDGPDPDDTPRILDALDRHDAKATFFVIGERAAAQPALVREILARGHAVGNHTHTHPSGTFWAAGPRRVAREIDVANTAIQCAAGASETTSFVPESTATPVRAVTAGCTSVFRPAVGIKSLFLRRALDRRGLTCIGWSIRSRDSRASDADAVVARIGARVAPGAILLLHEGPALRPAVRVAAIDAVLAELNARGYRCVIPSMPQWRTGAARMAQPPAKPVHRPGDHPAE